MTIANTTEASPLYTGNGSTTMFATGFDFEQNADVQVLTVVIATGVETTMTLGTDYTLTGAGVDGGGTVTFIVAPTTAQYVKIVPNNALTQGTSYPFGTPFPSSSFESNMDQTTLYCQQLDWKISRAPLLKASSQNYPLVFPDGSASAPNVLIGYDSSGVLLTTYSTASLIVSGSLTGSTGIVAQTAPGSFAARTITGTANQITVTNGDGVAGNPTISLPTSMTFTGITVTGGTFNYAVSTYYDSQFTLQNFSDGTKQLRFSLASVGTGTTVTLTVPSASGTIATQAFVSATYQPIATNLTALLAVTASGLIAVTGTNTYSSRTLTGTAPIAVTNGTGAAGNPTVALDTIDLTTDGAPDAVNDYIITYKSGSSVYRKVAVGTVASATSIPDVVYAGTYMALTTLVI